MFEKIREMYQFQKKAKQIQADLKKMEFTAEKKGVTVVVNGTMEVLSVNIDPEFAQAQGIDRIGSFIADAINDAVQKAQKQSAARMKEITGSLGLPF